MFISAFNNRVTQGSILGPLFLIYLHNSSNDLSSNPKLFSDHISFFSTVHDTNQSGIKLNDD